jgi:hypothetical protein
MSEPRHQNGFFFEDQRYVWDNPCRLVRRCDCWDGSDLHVRCSTLGCLNYVEVEYATYTEDSSHELKSIGALWYNARRNDALYECPCRSPVCEDCSRECSHGPCRICGERANIDVFFKNNKRLEGNFSHVTHRDWWMMNHQDYNNFIQNFGERDYQEFLVWFRAQGGKISIIELNTRSMCNQINSFKFFKLEQYLLQKLHESNAKKFLDWFFATSKLKKAGVIDCSQLSLRAHIQHIPDFHRFCLNRFFLASTSNLASFKNRQFETFMRHSAGIVGSLEFIIFDKKDLKRYRLFGFMMKMIERVAQSFFVLQDRQRLPHFFARLHARINGKLLNM